MQHQINAAIQIIPKAQNIHYYELIDRAIDVIKASGIKHIVGPMETAMEGDYPTIMKVMEDAQKTCLEAGADEVIVNIKLHIRKNGDVSFEEKLDKY